MNKLCSAFVDLSCIINTIDEAIVDDPPLVIKEGNIIKDGYNKELDELRDIRKNGKKWLMTFEENEKKNVQESKVLRLVITVSLAIILKSLKAICL